MGRLIDADKLKKHYYWWGDCEERRTFDEVVDRQPTVAGEAECKECGMKFYTVKPPMYCPHCGKEWKE